MANPKPWITGEDHLKDVCERLPLMFKNGESVAEICADFGIARSTFYLNIEKHEDLKEAYAMGKVYCEAWWQRLGRAGAAGKVDIQPTVFIANMNNRFGWTNKVDHSSSDSSMSPPAVTYQVIDE
jgi:hypothetical protein